MAKYKRVAPIFQIGSPGHERFILWGMAIMEDTPEMWFEECTAPTVEDMKKRLEGAHMALTPVMFLEFEWED